MSFRISGTSLVGTTMTVWSFRANAASALATGAAVAERIGDRTLVETIRIRGIRYVDVYQ